MFGTRMLTKQKLKKKEHLNVGSIYVMSLLLIHIIVIFLFVLKN